jgi:hypothetical protein
MHCRFVRLLVGFAFLQDVSCLASTTTKKMALSLLDKSSPSCDRVQSFQLNVRNRRRRNDDSSISPDDGESDTRDELPDFDIVDDSIADSSIDIKSVIMKKSASSEGVIKINKLISNRKPAGTLNDLIADRSLESKFKFDEVNDSIGLPDLAPIEGTRTPATVDRSSQVTPTKNKRERQEEARRKAALAAEKEREEKEKFDLIDTLPGIRDDNGKISGLKVLETGTWACIYILVAWEIYINTPFFDRAAPMTPIVY